MKDSINNKSEIFIMPFLITLTLSAYVFAFIYYYFYKTDTVQWNLIIGSSAAWLYIPLKKYTKNYHLYSNWLLICLISTLSTVAYKTGGLGSPAVWWLIFVPIISSFLLNLIATFIWSLISILVCIILILPHAGLIPGLNELTTSTPILAWSLSLLSIISIVAFLIIILKMTFEKLERKKNELTFRSFINSNTNSLGELASSVAHEVNNPLAIIRGHSELLQASIEKDPSLSEKQKKAFNRHLLKIEDATENAVETVKSLGYLTKVIDVDNQELFHIHEVMKLILSLNQKKFLLKNIELKIPESEDFMSLQIYGNKSQFVQALLNLINNSYEAVGEKKSGWVEINYEIKAHRILLKIKDSGEGIPIGLQEKVFQPLFTTKKGNNAKGLGLSLAKSMIENNKGKLYLDNMSGNTTFIAELPLAIN